MVKAYRMTKGKKGYCGCASLHIPANSKIANSKFKDCDHFQGFYRMSKILLLHSETQGPEGTLLLTAARDNRLT